jgi:hypothetical protein
VHVLDAVRRHRQNRRAELLQARDVGERPRGPEVRDLQRPLERERRRHDLAEHRADAFVGERPRVLLLEPFENLLLPLRRVDPDLFLFLDAPHLGDDRRAAVEETEDRVIDLVDPIAKRLEGLIRHGIPTR